ncbi:MAG: stage III sporulation protein AE [Oscillospiraceae bacterium]|nr:stage III sporulation protein AE [Oscillospiraceae bacterium]
MKKITIVLLLFLLLIIPTTIYATETTNEVIDEQKSSLNIQKFIDEANKYTTNVSPELNAESLLTSAIKGDVNNNTIASRILSLFGSEIVDALKLLGTILAIIVIGSILKTVTENMENKSATQIAYYVQYILIVTVMFKNFSDIVLSAREAIQGITGFMNLLVPILITLMISTGSLISANLVQPILLFFITFVGNMISNIIIPFILVGTVLGVISQISDKIQIGKIAKYFKTSTIWIMGITLTIFVGVLSLEGTLSSTVDGITAKTAKAAISGLIPIVGKVLGDAIDTVMGSAVILKNAVGLVGIVTIISICILPIIKLILLSLTYTVATALSEPIADGKIVKLLEQFGDTFKLLLAILFVVSVMFLIGIAIVVKMSNSGMMYR